MYRHGVTSVCGSLSSDSQRDLLCHYFARMRSPAGIVRKGFAHWVWMVVLISVRGIHDDGISSMSLVGLGDHVSCF